MKLCAIGRWGRFPTFQAKVGTGSSTVIIIKRARDFTIGQQIEFAETRDLQGMCKCCTPKWHGGLIWKIEDNRLFLDRV